MSEPLTPAAEHSLARAYEDAARRVQEAILASCDPEERFSERLGGALEAALEFCAAEPELGLLLTTRPFGEDHELLIPVYRRWQASYAELLRDTAAASPKVHRHPAFFEPLMIAGICFCISRNLGGERPVRDLLPTLHASVLDCYQREEGPRLRAM
jgi:hypothetical protein